MIFNHGIIERANSVPISATYENVTAPGDNVHWGDTIRVIPADFGNGKNYWYTSTFNASPNDSAQGDFMGNDPFEIVVGGGGGWVQGCSLTAWLDEDPNLTNASPTARLHIDVLAPR